MSALVTIDAALIDEMNTMLDIDMNGKGKNFSLIEFSYKLKFHFQLMSV